ncbi:MAG: replication-relaxation family protein [Bacillota bacterium]
MLTERDAAILRFINRFGYLAARHVTAAFGMHHKATYRRLGRMVKEGYLRHIRPLKDEPGVYLLTERGIDACESERARARLRLHTFRHDLLVADVAIVLARATGGEWITERDLRADAGGIGRPGPRAYVPDGALVRPGGARIAVEVEITSKPRARLEKILRGYVRRPEFAEVWYYTATSRLAEKIEAAARRLRLDFVQAKTIKEVLPDERSGANQTRTVG